MSELSASVAAVAKPWEGSRYYSDAEPWTEFFWRSDSPFTRLFASLDTACVIELACGHGRHSEIVAPRCGQLHLMDVLASNIDFCRGRFADNPRITLSVNNGHDFRPIEDNSITAIYCYDSMVHFHPDVVRSYVMDSARVLKSGGRALYHHSNFPGPGESDYMRNPHARNAMTQTRFAGFALEAGLKVVESVVMDWDSVKGLDCLTLLEKQ